MSIGTLTWQNENIHLSFPLINLNFQALENRQTCQHKHTQMPALGTALPRGQRGATQGQGQAASPFSPPVVVPWQLGVSATSPGRVLSPNKTFPQFWVQLSICAANSTALNTSFHGRYL